MGASVSAPSMAGTCRLAAAVFRAKCWYALPSLGVFGRASATECNIEQNNPPIQGIDVDPLCWERLTRTGGTSLFATLIELFARSWADRCVKLQTAIAEHDWYTFELTAHSLGSSAGNLGLRKIEQLARAIENAASSQNQARLQGLLEGLEPAWAQAEPQLRRAMAERPAE